MQVKTRSRLKAAARISALVLLTSSLSACIILPRPYFGGPYYQGGRDRYEHRHHRHHMSQDGVQGVPSTQSVAQEPARSI